MGYHLLSVNTYKMLTVLEGSVVTLPGGSEGVVLKVLTSFSSVAAPAPLWLTATTQTLYSVYGFNPIKSYDNSTVSTLCSKEALV